MKKKWLMMGASLGIGAVMLFVSGFSAMANTSGYEVYKTALKNNKAVQSITNNGSITVTDNGEKVLTADFNAKVDRDQNVLNAAVTFDNGDETHAANVFHQDGKVIFKTNESDVYRVMEKRQSKWKPGDEKSHPLKEVEPVVDELMGNLKELATVETTADGGKQAALHLSGSQIPAAVNALGSLAVSKVADCEYGNDAKANIPKLVENIKVREINLDAGINVEDYLERQTGEIFITGTDASGEEHEVVIALDFHLSDFNRTVPDQIDLTDKQVETIQHDQTNAPWHH